MSELQISLSIYSNLTANETTLDVKICCWVLRTHVLKRILWDNISKFLKVITTFPRCFSASSLCKVRFVNRVYINSNSSTFEFYFGYFIFKFQIYMFQFIQRGKLIILNNCGIYYIYSNCVNYSFSFITFIINRI